ncbi:hypothetical protein, conserved [Entamoeba dispar SAW760]|uniref:Rab-GAP TBC domain-containing protein n=1 Tax=Entamoeba dispar (strain ATCC PRA-260 / SAW760) TaxID=370354 RepID=B0EFJ5_ENTDS|nr:uncharacterized protein EDI_271930 [Entamoeba dispar SAW760]EDR26677.1 hypothetical protein, conserved [Entamoeba dispar SAW760]|eukprot:EDR26677.1 hypothetical protein, conserved [Entamoeba dispar SAW760]
MSDSITDIFKSLYLDSNGFEKLKKIAIEEGLSKALRPLAWKIFLKVIKPQASEEWIETMNKQRKSYDDLRAMHWENKEKLEPKVAFVDPLAPPTEDPEIKFNKDILRRVEADVNRLFSDQEYFTDPQFREKITRMCYIFAKDHKDKNYQQGFHEIMAIIYHTFDTDITTTFIKERSEQISLEEPNKSILLEMFNTKYLEEDTYITFEYLMKDLGVLYEFRDLKRSVADNSSKIQEKCEAIFDNLNQYDSQYHSILLKHQVLSVFGIKWLKMMFAREFLLADSVIIWDAIFAYGSSLKLCDGFFLAMLHYIRNDIVEHDDYIYIMKRVTKFPPVENLHNLIKLAVNIAEGNYPIVPKPQQIQQPNITQKLTSFLHGKKDSSSPRPYSSVNSSGPIGTRASPATLEAVNSNETPSWIVESPWGETPSTKKANKEKKTNEESYQSQQQHQVISDVISKLNEQYKKEPIDKEAIKLIISELNQLIEN